MPFCTANNLPLLWPANTLNALSAEYNRGPARCYNASAHFLNGGCLCDNSLINTVSTLNSVPRLAKDGVL